MENSPILALPLVMPNQAQAAITHNEALLLLDALVQLSVADRDLATPPSSPSEGDRYIVAAGATGAWSGWAGSVALWLDGAWERLTPREGWLAWVRDEDVLLAWSGTAWGTVTSGGGGGPYTLFGVNATATTTNRLSVKSDAVLLSHDDVTPGTGNMQLKANKSASGGTSTLLFQTGFSGRAEMGLAGSDDFKIKVSADGSTWKDALSVDRTTGIVAMPLTYPALKVLTAENTSGTSMADNTYTNQTFSTTTRNDFGSGAWNGTTFTVPAAGVYDLSMLTGADGSPSATSAFFYKNGASQLGFSEIQGVSGQNTIMSRAVLSLASGDTIVARMRHNAGSTQPGLVSSVFSVVRLA